MSMWHQHYIDEYVRPTASKSFPNDWGYDCPVCPRTGDFTRTKAQAIKNLRNHLRSHDLGVAKTGKRRA